MGSTEMKWQIIPGKIQINMKLALNQEEKIVNIVQIKDSWKMSGKFVECYYSNNPGDF